MDRYVEKFIKLCKNVTFEPKKNQTKLDVIKHNSAIKKLFKLCDEIASHCLKLDIYIDRAQKVLNAELLLEAWQEGKL